jgi:hypothetical protein
MWRLLPCFALVTATVGLAAVAIQGLVGKLGTLVVAEGAQIRDTVAQREMSGSQELILRFNKASNGALVEV